MSALLLKLQSRSGTEVTRHLTTTTKVGELKSYLSQATSIPRERLAVLTGFPPRPLDLKDDTRTLEQLGLSSGQTLILEERSVTEPVPTSDALIEPPPPPEDCRLGILMKMVVPSDNSCLFTSIGFVLNGKVDTTVGTLMRQIIATEVSSDKETYSEAMLGKPNHEYCDWIQQSTSWGGAIEVAILSRFYGIEMAVVDTLNAIINRFGEDRDYGQRVFLLFDGVHYDPLYLEQPEGGMQTIFPSENLEIYQEAEQLAREAKSSRQFTDLNKFMLKCMDCGIFLTGQAEAQQHAKETQHTNFGEV